MTDAIRGDVLSKEEMKQRGIYIIPGDRGGVEFRSIHSGMLVDSLLNDGYIEHYHYHDALVFMDLRRAYEAIMGIKWVRVDIAPEEGQMTSGEAAKRYDAIRHQMGVQRAATVAAIIAHAFEPVRSSRAEVKDVYRSAFEDLSKAMEEVDKKLNEMLATI